MPATRLVPGHQDVIVHFTWPPAPGTCTGGRREAPNPDDEYLVHGEWALDTVHPLALSTPPDTWTVQPFHARPTPLR